MQTTLQPTIKIELEVPRRLFAQKTDQLQRSMIHYLLVNGELTMQDALSLLPTNDQAWLVQTLLHDLQESLFLADTVSDPARKQQFWSQCKALLEYLFDWHEHWSEFHNYLLSLLHTVVRRYAPQNLTPECTKLLARLVQRLHEKQLYQEDVFSAKRSLKEIGLDTNLDLSPVADQLFASYMVELNRA